MNYTGYTPKCPRRDANRWYNWFKMKRLVALLTLLVVIIGLFMPGDSKASNNEIASSVNQTDRPLSANATITIIMTTPPLPDG